MSQPLSRPLSPLLRNPIPEYVGPETPILTIHSGPHGENGISRAIECPKNISGSEIIKIFGMSDNELDNSNNSLVKRKRTMEEDTAIVRAKHHRVFQSAWSSEFDVLQKILKKSDKTWNWNSIVKHKNIDISEIDENDFMNYLLGIGRDSNDNRVSIGSGRGLVITMSGEKIKNIGYGLYDGLLKIDESNLTTNKYKDTLMGIKSVLSKNSGVWTTSTKIVKDSDLTQQNIYNLKIRFGIACKNDNNPGVYLKNPSSEQELKIVE